VTGRYRLRWVL